jgi:hypothetical protein
MLAKNIRARPATAANIANTHQYSAINTNAM